MSDSPLDYQIVTRPETAAADVDSFFAAPQDKTVTQVPADLVAAVKACIAAAPLAAGADVEVSAAQGDTWLVIRVATVQKDE